jgi:hypothetical protein
MVRSARTLLFCHLKKKKGRTIPFDTRLFLSDTNLLLHNWQTTQTKHRRETYRMYIYNLHVQAYRQRYVFTTVKNVWSRRARHDIYTLSGTLIFSTMGSYTCRILVNIFFPMPPHVRIDFVVPPPGCGRSVTKFWGWGAHRAQLRCPDDVSDMYERGVPAGALNLNSTG